MDRPQPGVHYPRSLGEFEAWFGTDADCLDYLQWLRWPTGFLCPSCGHTVGWMLSDRRWECAQCNRRVSVTSGTIFDRTRTPLTVWFAAVWTFATSKSGLSALALQRNLEIGSYQTAWMILHRLRQVLVRPGRALLSGRVEVDETYIGGHEVGLRGGRAKGKKVLTAIAVETTSRGRLGRCRLAPLPDATGESLHAFITDHIAPGATIVTDGWRGYQGLDRLGYRHEPRSQRAAKARGEDIATLLPGVHRVASLVKRWILSTHQGSVTPEHLPSYLNEFTFRFNRRTSSSRGMVFYRVLELAMAHAPVRYTDIAATKRPRKKMPTPPQYYATPPSLEREPAMRPWRRTEQDYSG